MNEALRARVEQAISNADGQLGITKISAKDLKALLRVIDEKADEVGQRGAPRKS